MSDLTVADVAARLAGLPPAQLEAPALLARLRRMQEAGSLTLPALVEIQPQVEAALQALDNHVEASQGVINRCKALPPQPGSTVPDGF